MAFETIRVKRHRRRYLQIQWYVRHTTAEREKAERHAAWLYARSLAVLVMIKLVLGAELTDEERAADLTHFVYNDADPHSCAQRGLKYLKPSFADEFKTMTSAHELFDMLPEWLHKRFQLVKQLEDGCPNYSAPWNIERERDLYGFDPMLVVTTHSDTRKWVLRKNIPLEQAAQETRQSRSPWERFMRWMAGNNYR